MFPCCCVGIDTGLDIAEQMALSGACCEINGPPFTRESNVRTRFSFKILYFRPIQNARRIVETRAFNADM